MTTQETWHMPDGVVVDTWTWDSNTHHEGRDLGSKADWETGPWTEEPDKLSWTDPATDYPCLIVRGPLGALCGYVGVDEAHRFFGHPYDGYGEELSAPDVDPHGGLTFAGPCHPHEDEGTGICHVPQLGKSDTIWWFGFDCAHAFDLVPGLIYTTRLMYKKQYTDKGLPLPEYALVGHHSDTYRDVYYVMAQCASLAEQLSQLNHLPELTTGS